MTTDRPPRWPQRLLHVSALLLVVAAVVLWTTPTNVPSTNLVPYGCGSPGTPSDAELARFICTSKLSQARHLAVALVIAAGLLLLASQIPRSLVARVSWLRGMMVVAPLAIPVLAVSVMGLFSPLAQAGADGTLIRCGTAIRPSTDSISTKLCGQLPQERWGKSLGGATLAGLTLAGGAYVGLGTRRSGDDEIPGASAEGEEAS
ncbi:MAG: hypothetical protein L0G89_01075 [Janibacter sp.]|nr:hypothetical protein [Janibacter sp.]